jgi:NADP-dependent 3-hydroxy acid dehydrogenase YdfG
MPQGDKVIYITGASTGIGAATAKMCVAKGWKVALLARSKDKLAELLGRLGHDNAVAHAGDVANPEDQQAAIDAALAKWGRLDVAFANAGTGVVKAGAEGGDLDAWRTMVDVNVWGVLITAKLALPHLRGVRGHVILTGSRAARTELKGSVYGATKHFVHGFAANLLAEMRDWGGRCTVIAPGLVDTPFFDTPHPDALKPNDVARAVVYAIEQPPHVATGEIYLMPTPTR